MFYIFDIGLLGMYDSYMKGSLAILPKYRIRVKFVDKLQTDVVHAHL